MAPDGRGRGGGGGRSEAGARGARPARAGVGGAGSCAKGAGGVHISAEERTRLKGRFKEQAIARLKAQAESGESFMGIGAISEIN